MMDHIRQFDWCTSTAHGTYFIDESVLDNCNTEKIIQNRFTDPLLSSEDEEEQPPNVIDWDEVFKNNDAKVRQPKIFVPGLRPVASYSKLSTLTTVQHQRGLRVLCAMYPNVLEQMNYHKPNPMDHRNFEKMKAEYDKEKTEYIKWAKTVWTNNHCIRALRPKPVVEKVYEAEFKVRAQRLRGYPKYLNMAAQIPLESTRGHVYEASLTNTLIEVNVKELPHVSLPEPIDKLTSIIRPCTVPETCQKHPYQFVLPTENSVSILPITEIHRELAQYAAEHGSRFIASENALRCLVEFNGHWTLPISVCSVFNSEGERCNVVVLDSEVSVKKEPAIRRTYRAFRHLLQHALIPSSEIEKVIKKIKNNKDKEAKKRNCGNVSKDSLNVEPELSSDDESMGLCIMENVDIDDAKTLDVGDTADTVTNSEPMQVSVEISDKEKSESNSSENNVVSTGDTSIADVNDIIGVYNCTCTDTLYETPPLRSYKKWQISNNNTKDNVNVIVHCSHKARLNFSEVVMEPIPEYQLELGGSEQPPDRIRSLALSLMLRKKAVALKVRVDGCNGDLVALDTVEAGQVQTDHSEHCQQVVNVLHTTLSELQGLVPGHYVLLHEPGHCANALLYVARAQSDGTKLELAFDTSHLLEVDEARMAKVAPTIAPVLLPYHKYRNILPCAFSPYEHENAKGYKKRAAKQKTPPQAIKWPKRRNRGNRRKNK